MAVLMDLLPPGLTFQALTGDLMCAATSSCHPSAAEPERGEAGPSSTRDQVMRIYLPDGSVRLMRLTEYQEFLQSYRIENLSSEEPES